MRKVYYKGQPYYCKTVGAIDENPRVSLYDNQGVLRHFVEEQELDRRSILKVILDAYYRSIMEEDMAY